MKRLVRPIKQQQARLAYIRFETMPGVQAQVDWADFQISEPDGSTRTVYLFILVLGYCRAIYAEFVSRCTLESFLDGHIRAFRYLGGVASELLYDNMKHVVIRHLVGKVRLQCRAAALRPPLRLRPQGLPAVCRLGQGQGRTAGGLHPRELLAGLPVQSTLSTANRDLRHWLDTMANRRVHGTHRQPVIERWQQEKARVRAAARHRLRHLAEALPQGLQGLPGVLRCQPLPLAALEWSARRCC